MTPETIEDAIGTVARRLALPDAEPLGPDELALVLSALAQAHAVDCLGSRAELRERLAGEDYRARVAQALLAALHPFAAQDTSAWEQLSGRARLRLPREWLARLTAPEARSRRDVLVHRSAQLALEDLGSERVAPEIRVAALPPTPDELDALMPGRYTHGLIHGESIHAANELFPLMLDAYTHDLALAGSLVTNVVGVHVGWLTAAGDATRVWLYEAARETLRELPLPAPRRLDSVHFLYLGADEQARHRDLSSLFSGRPQLNPFALAKVADDKQAAFERLRAAGVATPRCLLLRESQELETLAQRLATAGFPASCDLVVQPQRGTEGEGVTRLSLRADDHRSLHAAVQQIGQMIAHYGAVVAREYVSGRRFAAGGATYAADLRLNVAWDAERFVAESGYLQVAGDTEAVASSVGRGGRIVSLSCGALAGLGASAEDLAQAQAAACAAANALVTQDTPGTRLSLLGVDVRLAPDHSRTRPVVLDLNPRPAGLSYSEFFATREPGVSLGVWRSLMCDSLIDRILTIIREDRDDDHRLLLDQARNPQLLYRLIGALRGYLRLAPTTSGQRNILLLQERAILILGDALWRLKQLHARLDETELSAILADVSTLEKTRADIRLVVRDAALEGPTPGEPEYLAFINQFLVAVNEREMRDFTLAKDELMRNTPRRRSAELRLRDPGARYEAVSPMRVGLSSANASDNWTFSKLHGGAVVNFAVDLAMGAESEPRPPIAAELDTTTAATLELRTVSHLQTDRPTAVVLSRENARDFLALPKDGAVEAARCFRDIQDPLLLLKYALVFSGIVGFKEDPQAYVSDPARILDDVRRFSGGRGLRLTLRSAGPSRSGFASSSCVALALLQVLYTASGQEELTQRETLSSLALLLENEVGLKSGKQDTDGPLYPGVKSLRYRPTTGFLASEVVPLTLDEAVLNENLMLVNSGIQRPPASGLRRGLNMRHYSYVSRDPRRFPAVMRSLAVHESIVAALVAGDWPRLGALFGEYLDLRETIDPGATQSIYDAAAGTAVLRLPFVRLKEQGLIHGGMYSGAMGGGCMMLVATPRGKEALTNAAGRQLCRLAAALEELRSYAAGELRPFAGLEIYRYAVNARGLTCRVSPSA